MRKILVGLMGRAGSGKDTFADMLEASLALHSSNVNRFAFADPLYAAMDAMFPPHLFYGHDYLRSWKYVSRHDKEEYVLPGVEKTPRQILQTLGTEWGRHVINQDLWTNLAYQNIDRSDKQIHVITDLRFENEVLFVKNFGLYANQHSLIVHITRPSGDDTPHSSHASEQRLDITADTVITNDSSLMELRQKATTVANQILTIKYNMPFNSKSGSFHHE